MEPPEQIPAPMGVDDALEIAARGMSEHLGMSEAEAGAQLRSAMKGRPKPLPLFGDTLGDLRFRDATSPTDAARARARAKRRKRRR